MGRDRDRRALRDVAVAFVAVSRRGPDRLDRADGPGAEYFHLAVQFPHLRFPRGLDVCARCGHRWGNGAAGRKAQGDRGTAKSWRIKFWRIMTAGMPAADELSAGVNPQISRHRPVK